VAQQGRRACTALFMIGIVSTSVQSHDRLKRKLPSRLQSVSVANPVIQNGRLKLE
jgi:hypothetical protein